MKLRKDIYNRWEANKDIEWEKLKKANREKKSKTLFILVRPEPTKFTKE